MQAVTPVSEKHAGRETTFGTGPLMLLLSTGITVSRWRPSWRERIAVLFGADVFLSMWTHGREPQTAEVTVGEPEELKLLPAPARHW